MVKILLLETPEPEFSEIPLNSPKILPVPSSPFYNCNSNCNYHYDFYRHAPATPCNSNNKKYNQHYIINFDTKKSSWPIFIIFITTIQICSYIYSCNFHHITLHRNSSLLDDKNHDTTPSDIFESNFIYCPEKQAQVWRFLLYMILHTGWVHLLFNTIVQLLLGIPLELSCGSLHIGFLYLLSVLSASLTVSTFQPNVCLVGGSGGIYGILAGHLAHIIINYKTVEFVVLKSIGIVLICILDVLESIFPYQTSSSFSIIPPWLTISSNNYGHDYSPIATSKLAHISGAFSGLCIGLIIFKNNNIGDGGIYTKYLRWFAFGIYGAYMSCIILLHFV